MQGKGIDSYPSLSTLWQVPGIPPTEVMTGLNHLPSAYYNYILRCLAQPKTSLPKPEFELHFLLNSLKENEAKPRAHGLVEKFRDLYIELMLACAKHNLDEITDYQSLLENDFNPSGKHYRPLGCMKRLLKLLDHFDEIGRDRRDPRVVFIFNSLLTITKEYSVKPTDFDVKLCLRSVALINERGAVAEDSQLSTDVMLMLKKIINSFWVIRNGIDYGEVEKYFENLQFIQSLYRLYGKESILVIIGTMKIDTNSAYRSEQCCSCLLLSQLVTQLPGVSQSDVLQLLGDKLYDYIWPDEDSFSIDRNHFQAYQKLINEINSGAITFNDFIENTPLVRLSRKPFDVYDLLKFYQVELGAVISAFIAVPNSLAQMIEYFSAVKQLERKPTELERLCENILMNVIRFGDNHSCMQALASLSFSHKEQLIELLVQLFEFLVLTDNVLEAFLTGLSENQCHTVVAVLDKKGMFTKYQKQFLLDDKKSYIPTIYENDHEMQSFISFALSKGINFSLAKNFNSTLHEQCNVLLTGDPSLLRHLPIGLATAVINSHEVPASIETFVARFDKANQHAGDGHAINYKHFMLEHMHRLVNLYEILGNDLFPFLTKCIATSVLWLSRFLENILHVPAAMASFLKETYDRCGKKYEIEFCDLLTLLSQYNYVTNQLNSSPASIHDDTISAMNRWWLLLKQPEISLEKLYNGVTSDLVTVYRNALQIPSDTNLNLSKLLQNRELMPNLMVGRTQVRQSHFSHVLDRLIIEHIKEEGSFIDFTTNIHQADPLGKALAEHNNAIRTKLSQNNIDVELAFNYQKQKEFVVRSQRKVDMPTLYNAIWSDIANVTTQLNDLCPSISKVLGNIKTQVFKGCMDLKPRLDRLTNEICMTNFNEFTKLYEELISGNNVPDGLREHGNHLKDRIAMLTLTKKKDKSSGDQPGKMLGTSKRYLIKRWDKNNIHTFLLGNDVHCCLATNGGRFEANIQRVIDGAMFMDTVTDVELGEVVSLNWLYYGEDEKNSSNIYVVANFYEIRPGIGMKAEMRDQIVHELTEFTGEFAKDIRAKGYLVAPLTYGIIPDFKDQFETKAIKIKKVGGYFNPVDLCTYDANDEENKSRYYLTSVDLDKFYLHATPKPAAQFTNANELSPGHTVFFLDKSNKKSETERAQLRTVQDPQSQI